MTIIDRAAAAGVAGAYRFWAMTPREIEWELSAFAAARRREEERIDLLAFLIGRYGLFAVHAPRRYPKRPDGLKAQARPMSDGEMKRVFLALAGRDSE